LVRVLAFLTSFSGCQALQDYRPVSVLVRDIETQKPIAGAEVRVAYLLSSLFGPQDCLATTGPEGIAHLRAAPYGETALALDVAAAGYLTEHQKLKVATIRQIEPAHWFENTAQRPVNLVVELYAQPEFSVELVVPVGYRGLIRAQVQIDETARCPLGQRRFRYEIASSGKVLVIGPTQILKALAPAYGAVYADGSPLDGQMDATKVGFRWLKTEGQCQYFVVGTEPEYRRFCHELLLDASTSGKASGTGRAGGHSGRRRKSDDTSMP
jgi:hypothetical protein